MFELLQQPAPDPILALGGLFRADDRPEKLDLGIGVYRDETGRTPIMRSVRAAEERLLESRTTKSYVGPRGDAAFAAVIAEIAFGKDGPHDRIGGLQTPGGTGALRVLAGLLAATKPQGTVWIPDPTWANHVAILTDAGLRVRTYPYYDRKQAVVLREAMLETLADAAPGDAVLVHGCCHNPTGADLSEADWEALGGVLARRNLLPFVDLAYQGFGRGLEEDAFGVRYLAGCLPEMLVATSCSKNFCIYSERTGCAVVLAQSRRDRELATAQMTVCARALYSMPPDHGSAIVPTIWEDPTLRIDWWNELEKMQDGRINIAGLPVAGISKLVSSIMALREQFGPREF